jgi:general secretion pathway protein D
MPNTKLALVLAAAVTAGLVLRVPAAHAQPTSPTPPPTPAADPADDAGLYACKKLKNGQVTVSLKPETELKDLITWVMGFTCKNFIYEPGLIQRSKKVTVISPNKMSPQDAYRLFLVALSTMGVTVVPKGNALRIVEAGQAKGETVPVYRRGAPANTDEMVRFLFRPSFMTADTMTNALNVIKSKDGAVNQVGNIVLVTDYASQIRDMITLAKELDKPSANEGIYTILVQYADAKELQAKLTEILGIGTGGVGGGGGGGG